MNCEAHLPKREADGTPRTCGEPATHVIKPYPSTLHTPACDRHLIAVMTQQRQLGSIWLVTEI